MTSSLAISVIAAILAAAGLVEIPREVPVGADSQNWDTGASPPNVPRADWSIAGPVTLENTTFVSDGNITVEAGGHLRLVNATLIMNSTYELQYRIEVLSGGALTFVDLDGDNRTTGDASVITAGNRGNPDPFAQDDYFHYAFRVRDGASLVIENSEVREVGDHNAASEGAGLYIEADGVRVVRTYFTGNVNALLFHGNATMLAENATLDGNTFEGNFFAINGVAFGFTIVGNWFRSDSLPDVTARDMIFASNILDGPSGGTGANIQCLNNCTIEGNRYRDWGVGLGVVDSANVTIRNDSFYNSDQLGGGLGITRSQSTFVETVRATGGRAGLRLFASQVEVRDSVFDGGFEGFWADFRCQTLMVNSTISNVTRYSVLLSRDSHLVTLNTTFDKATAAFVNIIPFSGPPSTLGVDWFLDVLAEDSLARPLTGATVEVRNATATLASGLTAGDGRLRWTVAREYVQSDLNADGDGTDPGEIVYDTPHNVTATFQGMTAYAVPEPFVNETMEVVVRFPASLDTVTITRSPEVGQVRVDGTWYDVPATFSWLSGTTHAIEAPPIDEYAADSRYAFTTWSDGGAPAHSITTPAGGGTYVASYRTQHRPTVAIVGTDGHTVRFDHVVNGSAASSLAAGTWSEWVDQGSSVVPAAVAEGSSTSERWVTDASFAEAPWTPVTDPFTATVTYTHQFRLQVTAVGLPATSPAPFQFVQFGGAATATTSTFLDEWADAGTAASTNSEMSVGARERYRTLDPVDWPIDAPVDATVRYRRQFLHNIVLDGTDLAHLVDLAFTLDGTPDSIQVYGTWSNWSDATTALSVAAETTGDPPRTTDDPTAWTANAPLDVVVRYRERTSPPLPKENWKPLLALAFSLAILGAALVRRRRGADRRTLLLHLPFLATEAGIGIASWATGILSVPPWLGAGTIVNTAILLAGLLLPGWLRTRTSANPTQ